MKKFIMALLVSIITLCGFSSALDIPVTTESGEKQCNEGETRNVRYYLTTSGFIKEDTYDVFGNNVDSLVGGGNNGSSINIWRNGIISDCNIWNRVSNVVSAADPNGALTFLNTDGCKFNIPSNYSKIVDPTQIDAQIHYTIGYRNIFDDGAYSLTDKLYYRDFGTNTFTCYPNGSTVSNANNCPNVTVKYGNLKYHTGECINFRVFWCGDGLVNSPYGTIYNNGMYTEQCDPNDPNHVGWGVYGCSNTCEPLNPSCGNGILETGEQCEPSLPSTIPTGYICNSSCQLEQVGPICGNGELETGEQCEIATGNTNRNLNGTIEYNVTLNSKISVRNIGDGVKVALSIKDIKNINTNTNRSTAESMVEWKDLWVITTGVNPYAYFGNGCTTSCQLMEPTCSFTVTPPFQYVGVPSIFSGGTFTWATYTSFDFADGTVRNQSQLAQYITGNNHIRFTHTYNTLGIFHPVMKVINNYPAELTAPNVTRPWSGCVAQTEIVSGCVIEVIPGEVELGEPIQVNYTIWGRFVSAEYMALSPNSGFYYGINQNISSPITTGSFTGLADIYPIGGTGDYVFSITGTYADGALTQFACSGLLRVVDAEDVHDLTIEKTIDHEEGYHEGDVVHYTITVKNNGTNVESNYTIRDVLPLSVTYVESSIMFTDSNVAHNTFSSGIWVDSNGQTVLDYTGLTLYPGEKIVLSVTGVANEKIEDLLTGHVNVACLTGMYANICDTAPITFLANVIKDGNRTGFVPGDNVEYYITVQNTSNSPISYVRLHDIWPDDNSCIVYDSWTGQDLTELSPLSWQYNNVLGVGESFTFTIYAHVANNESCARTEAYHNVIQLTYSDGVREYKDNDFYDIWVRARELEPSALLEKTVDSTIVQEGDIVTYTITYGNDGDIPFVSHRLVDNWPSELEFIDSNPAETSRTTNTITWEFGSLATGETRTIILRGRVKELPNRDGSIINTVTLYYVPEGQKEGQLSDNAVVQYKGQDNSNCGNGILEKGEECDYGLRGDDVAYFIDWLDSEGLAYSEGSYGYCNSSCEIIKNNNDSSPSPQVSCHDVRESLAVVDDELFPFWRWVGNDSNLKFVNSNSESCNYKTGVHLINRKTMECTFTIYNGKYNQLNSDGIHTFKGDCYLPSESLQIFNYFKKIKSWRHDEYDAGVGASRVMLVRDVLGDDWDGTYGEYKIQLHDVSYDYCASDGKWKSGMIQEPPCESNFALNREYISQISTFGVTPIASNAKGFLDDYYDFDGGKIIEHSDIGEIMRSDSDTYSFDSSVVNQIDAFKNKYQGLAVAMDKRYINVSGDKRNITSVKKVPNKSIYFIEGSGKLVLNSSFSSTPFTIVVTGMDIVVEGSVTTNGMFITNKKISFDDPDCVDGGQVVQGIFIAQGGFKEGNNMLNLDENEERCQWGNLHVKGVLIGDSIDKISSTKRAVLNSWFYSDGCSANDDRCIKVKRRTEIFQGASVLIEYNPSLWAMLPPGAEIFTETLEVYRK